MSGAALSGVDRRQFLAGTGAVAAVGLIAAGGVSLAGCGSGPLAGPVSGWPQPKRIHSNDGLLEVTLVAEETQHEIAGEIYPMMSFGQGIPSPTWHVKPGDTLRVTLRNRLKDQPTNLHVHGLHVDPVAPADDVFLSIAPGAQYTYVYEIPEGHPPGYYWYHPHRHVFTNRQVALGMFGGIVVEGLEDDIPYLQGNPDAVVNIQGIWVNSRKDQVEQKADGFTSIGTEQVLVNGLTNPKMSLQQGVPAHIRFLNASPMSIAKIGIDGHKLNIVAVDGNPVPQTHVEPEWILSPGSRIDAIVLPQKAGNFAARVLPSPELSGDGDPPPPNGGVWYRLRRNVIALNANPLFELEVRPSDRTAEPVPQQLSSSYYTDLRHGTPAAFPRASIDILGPDLVFNNRQFNARRIDFAPELDTMEEWTFINTTTVPHPIHIHVNPVQVVEVNGKPVDEQFYRDTFLVPGYSRVKVRTRYETFTGRFVLHCHNLDHEDVGMMATVQVMAPGKRLQRKPELPPGVTDSMYESESHLHASLQDDGSRNDSICDLRQFSV